MSPSASRHYCSQLLSCSLSDLRAPILHIARDLRQSLLRRYGLIALLGFALCAGCRSPQLDKPEANAQNAATERSPQGESPVTASLVFVIHGDGDYIYHDRFGKELRADERVLAEAQALANRMTHSEVFIFHEKSRSKFLLLFDKAESEFYYFRGGILRASENYFRGQGGGRFESEARLLSLYKPQTPVADRVNRALLYYGHEIPEQPIQGYDESVPDASFGIDDFAQGLQRIFGVVTAGQIGRKPCDLIVLSTCYNGTPYAVQQLSPFGRYLIASPENLHLSYFSVAGLEELESTPNDRVKDVAAHFAGDSFEKLKKEVQTTITVSVYDLAVTNLFVKSLKNGGGVYSMKSSSQSVDAQNDLEHCDCGQLPAFGLNNTATGILTFYRPSNFGKQKNVVTHSGLECWKSTISAENPPKSTLPGKTGK